MEFSPYSALSRQVFDPVQNSDMGLIKTPHGDPNIELIEPRDETATTFNFLKTRGGGYHHICYEIDDEDELESFLKRHRIKKIYGPEKAVLFDNRHVVFGYTSNREIVEYLISKGS